MAAKTAKDNLKMTRPKALPGWKKWTDFVRAQSINDSSQSFNPKLNRANARFAMAVGFCGLNLEGFTEKSRLGYEAVLRLLLTYTAAEALADALGERVTQWRINDEKLASQIRPLFHAPPEPAESYDPEILSLRPVIMTLRDSTRTPLATSNSPTFGRSNSPGQDGLIISHQCLRAQGVQPLLSVDSFFPQTPAVPTDASTDPKWYRSWCCLPDICPSPESPGLT